MVPIGATESNAGDDFHFWWAANRALALIEPGTTSRLLVLEGLGRVDDPEDEYETVDVAEYFGSESFDDATALVLSQLKYSTRHPTKAWTAARICEKRTRRSVERSRATPRSVVADLADAFAQLTASKGVEVVAAKVRVSLVTNQPCDPLLQASVAAADTWAQTRPKRAQKAAMLRALAPEHAEVIQMLSAAIGTRLNSGAFCDFMRVLDLSQTGSLDRTALARSVRAGASELAPGRGPDSANRLFQLVRQEALPGSRRDGIGATDVLAELGVADLDDLYPAPPRLAEIADPLPAPGAKLIADAVVAHLRSMVVARGPAGAGKTTALRQIADHLPAGSTVILFDCFGGGEYLSSNDERHTPERFVMQTVNELAHACGTPLLLQSPPVESDIWRRLVRTLERASDTLDDGAVLVLAVDAADNAAVAAIERGDRGFLPGLVDLRLPPRVAVVLTSRSHRVASLGAARATVVELAPFDALTSAAHLRRYLPEASEADASEFHIRTDGNPRTQFYALTQGASAGWDMTALLEAARRTPTELFDDIVNSALRVSGADAGGQRWLALMLALARPVKVETLAAALGVDSGAVAAFAAGLEPGVRVTGGAIQFRDEDFEAHVRSLVDDADVVTAHGRLADLFLGARMGDVDAAAHVADHLFSAGRLSELVDLVLDEDSPQGITDGFRRQQVQGRRLDLAARAIADVGSAAAAVRLAARACDTASRLDTLSRLVESHLDLVARFADIDLLRTYALRQNRGEWLGPIQMRLAAALSRDSERQASARAALESANAWVRRWMAGRESGTRHWDLTIDDIGAAVEARYRLDGLRAAIAELRRWRPAESVLEAAVVAATRLADEIDSATVREALRRAGVPIVAQGPFLAGAGSPGDTPAGDWIEEVVLALSVAEPGAPRSWQTHVLDLAIRHGDPNALALAQHLAGALPTSRWVFRGRDSEGIAALRCHAAVAALTDNAIDLDALVPEQLQPQESRRESGDDQRAHDRREWLGMVKPFAAILHLACRMSAGRATAQELAALVDARLAELATNASRRWFRGDASYHTWAVLAAEAALGVGGPPELLDQIANAAPLLLRDETPALWLDLAEAMSRYSQHAEQAAELCTKAAAYVRGNTYPAPERLELLARAANIAGAVALPVGKQLFDYAIDAATGINDDAAQLLVVHAHLANKAAATLDDRAGTAARLVRIVEDVAPHVTSSEVIPYASVVGAVSRLDVSIGLATSSRWDDEDRIQLAATLPAALTGAVDGGGLTALEALVCDHLIEGDTARLNHQLAVIDQFGSSAAETAQVRRALTRAATWLRNHVPAYAQPILAKQLLESSTARRIDDYVRTQLEAVVRLAPPASESDSVQGIAWRRKDSLSKTPQLLDRPADRNYATLADDVAALADAHLYGDEIRTFVSNVARNAQPSERVQALAAVAALPKQHAVGTTLPVLAECLTLWRDWPGTTEWAASALPRLLAEYLPDLAWLRDHRELLRQLRTFGDDTELRRAILIALPEARTRLTAYGWQTIAQILGQLCSAADAADALRGLLTDRPVQENKERNAGEADMPDSSPLPRLLWSMFGHPRREMRWRAAHATRELVSQPDRTASEKLVKALIRCLDQTDAGVFRDPSLHFYSMSAAAALLVALERIAIERPAVLTPHQEDLARHATSRDLPHVQIRELARRAVLALANSETPLTDMLRYANQPTCCRSSREQQHLGSDRIVSADRRYGFDLMDTIPYWYARLARVFDLPVDAIAERAERWIIDRWGLNGDDWMTDARELRDERSWERTSHRHGSIPPEENLRLYLEYHAMMAVAGELVDADQPMSVAQMGIDDGEPWQYWLSSHVAAPGPWRADLRSPVPAEADLFGNLSPLDQWEVSEIEEFDRALRLRDSQLLDPVLVAGHATLHRPGGYSNTYIRSAIVTPDHAADLQRALAAAPNPTDWKLPDENDKEFEVKHGRFVLSGWLADPFDPRDELDIHDPYAHNLKTTRTLPGNRFRIAASATVDESGLNLVAADHAVIARVEQWADPDPGSTNFVVSSGSRTFVDRAMLLRYLADSGANLIVEVQIGRHRSGDYRLPRSHIYLIDPLGHVTRR
ncbi:NACHT domain-containing protein [Amycolatopsis thailandensis]|uniref:NACHT domain-containing protein n=1 Tax=Amycolatopsis thailandensis TaxID=589330 RepID=UPI0036287B9C